MAQRSWFWDGTVLGDAVNAGDMNGYGAPYTDDTFALFMNLMMNHSQALEGVFATVHPDCAGYLAVTNPAGTTIRVASGAAMVAGRIYQNTANVDLATSGDGNYSVVLRATFASQTIRAAIRSLGVTQNTTTWELEIARVTVTGGVHVVTDMRYFIGIPSAEKLLNRTILTAAGQVDWSSIPQIYNHLKIVADVRDNTNASGYGSLSIRFNGDSGANYHHQSFFRLYAADGYDNVDADTSITVGAVTYGGAENAEYSAPNEIVIPNYRRTTFYKNLIAKYSQYGTTSASLVVGQDHGQWRSTAAINRIQIGCYNGSSLVDFVAGSVLSLYGLL